MNVITRFAPSPTGYLHIGNIRTALYSWLISRKNNGKFYLRIEDTDLNRYNKKYVDNIFFILDWLGLHWDGKVVYQSKNLNIYKNLSDYLIRKNLAYKCYCDINRLKNIKYRCILNKIKPKYDNYCRINNVFFKNKSYVIRIKSLKCMIKFNDLVFKNIKFNLEELDDFVIIKSNGYPTYNFSCVIDDNIMGITHVVRGSEHINNTPKQINVIAHLNYKIPFYAHLPLIMDVNNRKLSKRNISSNILKYVDKGFLPHAIINYVARLGWSYKNLELLNIDNLIKLFNFKNISKSPVVLNFRKFIWINKHYINNLPFKKIIYYLKPILLRNNITNVNSLYEIISYVLPKCHYLNDIVDFCLLFINKPNYSKEYVKLFLDLNYLSFLYDLIKKIKKLNLWFILNINLFLNKIILKYKNLRKRNIFRFLRYILIGKMEGLSLCLIILLLKKKKTINRLVYFSIYLGKFL